MLTEHARIRFRGSTNNLEIYFEGEWCGWHTAWGQEDRDKTKRFRSLRDRVARALNGMDVDLTEHPEKVQK